MSGNKPERTQQRFATVAQVSAMLSLPKTTMYDHARANTIPGVVRVGRRILFDLDKLEAWLDAGGEATDEAAS